jgi:C4-dicarboxylate-specific signal transduction histidine kinase
LAHELNQPLAAILSNAQAARRFLDGPQSALGELRAILDDIVSDDKRAGEIIHRLRAMLRKEPAPRTPCDLNEIVREILSILNSELIARDVTVRTELDSALPAVEAARVEIQQVLINLLLNAAQAMNDTPPGQRIATVQTRCHDGNILIAVRDSGHGIPEEKVPRVFDAFFTTKTAGLGMGLAICRRLIETHGGWIKAENNPEGGAKFTFSLPAHAERSTPPEPDRAPTLARSPDTVRPLH